MQQVATAGRYHAIWVGRVGALLMLGASLLQAVQAATPGLRAIEQSRIPAHEQIRAVLMLERVPTTADVDALAGLGLTVQGLKHLPMVLSKGTPEQMQAAVQGGLARDAYLDKALQWHSQESTAAMNADITRQLGFDGAGVRVAIVDSGIDASHPDLADRVIRNVRVYSPEYLDITGVSEPTGIVWPSEPALVVAFDALPYNNTDTIGHGTHVAGITAGEGVGDGSLVGVAPGAELVGYSCGEILFIFTALAAFDDIMGTHAEQGIKVINNSWGSRFHVFDPASPINVATKALTDEGITVVFSAGNDGIEMTTNVHSMAPWVIMSGSATLSKEKSDFSSSGLMFDNSGVTEVVDGHVRFEGDGLGLSHPDVSAPGSDIVSTCTPTGAIVCGAVLPGGAASASGTSMSAPHMAGLAAILLQANPELTPDMVRQVMQVTAVPMRDGAAFWQSGFGFVDAKAAIDLVLRADFSAALLNRLEAEDEAQVLARRTHRVVSSDQWEFISIGASAFGLETYDFSVPVSADTTRIRASVVFPGDLGLLGLNLLFEWGLELLDPAGNVVATSQLTDNIGYLDFDLLEAGIPQQAADWTVRAIGYSHISQPGLLWGHAVTVAAVQLEAQESTAPPSGPVFSADGELKFHLSGGSGAFSSPENCEYDPAGASGGLSLMDADESCHAGTVGYLLNYGVGAPASFTSEPLALPTVIGGEAVLSTYLVTEAQPIYGLAFGSRLNYQLDALDEAGNVLLAVAGGELIPMIGPTPTLGEMAFTVPVTAIPAGARLRLNMSFTGVYTSAMRLLWGGEFADSGLRLRTGSLSGRSLESPIHSVVTPAAQPGVRGGATGMSILLVLVAAGLRRRLRHP